MLFRFVLHYERLNEPLCSEGMGGSSKLQFSNRAQAWLVLFHCLSDAPAALCSLLVSNSLPQ